MSDAEPPSDPREPRRNFPAGFGSDGMPRRLSRQMKARLLRCLGRSDPDPTRRRLPHRVPISVPLWTELSRKVGGDLFQNPEKLEIMRTVDRTMGPDVSWEEFSVRVVAAISATERAQAERAEMIRRVREKGRDPLADPRAAILQWILDARLAGGVSAGPDMYHARRSAELVFETLRVGEPGGPHEVFFHMACRHLLAYMMAMANRPDVAIGVEEMRSHLTQPHLAAMAEDEPERGIRCELEKAAICDHRMFAAALATLGL